MDTERQQPKPPAFDPVVFKGWDGTRPITLALEEWMLSRDINVRQVMTATLVIHRDVLSPQNMNGLGGDVLELPAAAYTINPAPDAQPNTIYVVGTLPEDLNLCHRSVFVVTTNNGRNHYWHLATEANSEVALDPKFAKHHPFGANFTLREGLPLGVRRGRPVEFRRMYFQPPKP